MPHHTLAQRDAVKNIEVIYEASVRTTTSTGLRVIAEIARKVYQPKIKPKPEFLADEPIKHDPQLSKYNYVIAPS